MPTVTIDGTNVDGVDVSVHAVAATGIHGVGANTILSSAHNVVLSSSIHSNPDLIFAYPAANSAVMYDNINSRIWLDTISSPGYDLNSLLITANVFTQTQADNNGCSATNIKDTGVDFQTIAGKTLALLGSYLTWSSDAGGTANTGGGWVTAVTDANNLAIVKITGADFANSYYFSIKSNWIKIKTAGYYNINISIAFYVTVANKRYVAQAYLNGAQLLTCFNQASIASDYMSSANSNRYYLAVNDLLSLVARPQVIGANTSYVYASSTMTFLSANLMRT